MSKHITFYDHEVSHIFERKFVNKHRIYLLFVICHALNCVCVIMRISFVEFPYKHSFIWNSREKKALNLKDEKIQELEEQVKYILQLIFVLAGLFILRL